MIRSLASLFLGTFLAVSESLASLPPAAPPVTQFHTDLDVYPQNFAITVDRDSRVFLGNADGVLIYDGEHWQLTPLSNGDIVRSLGYDGEQRIYVGGYDSFGYVEQNNTGKFRYFDLTERYRDFLGSSLFADIWHLHIADDAVYFVALEHLFRYEPNTGETTAWHHEGRFGPITTFQNDVILQWRGQGLKRYSKGEWLDLPDNPYHRNFLTNLVVINDDQLLLVSPETTWASYDGNEFVPRPKFDAVSHRGSVTFARLVTQQTLALATQLGKVVFVDLRTGADEVVDIGRGFIPELTLTPAGETLLVDDLGFYAVRWPARWRSIDHTAGLKGTIHRIIEVADATLVLSSSGIFRSQENRPFERLSWTDYEAWDLLPLDDGTLLFADSYDIKLISPGGIDTVADSTTARYFLRSRHNPDIVYVGTELGIQVLKKTDGVWQSIYRDDRMDNLRINGMFEITPDELLISSDRGGIQLLDTSQLEAGTISARRFGARDGLIANDPTRGMLLRLIDDKLIASTDAGFFEFVDGQFKATDLDGLTTALNEDYPADLAQGDQQIWAYVHDQIYKKNGHWEAEDVSGLNTGGINIIEFTRHGTLVGGLGKLLRFNEFAERTNTAPPPITVTSSTLTSEGGTTQLDLKNITLSSADERLTIGYAFVDLARPDQVRYRTRLKPREKQFSDWQENSEQSFVALPAGNYLFEVEGQNSLGQRASVVIPVQVTPQWFETAIARTTGIGVLFIALYFIASLAVRQRAKALAEERDRLETMVSKRTRALESANQQLDQMAHLDGLTQIPNRRKLDAYLADVWRQCVERDRMMAIAIIDVDHFKHYNDSHGHQAGDELLINLARTLSQNLRRAEDLVARYGGEEFLVVMPGAGEITARRVIEDMRQRVEAENLGVTVSAGVHASMPDNAMPLKDMIETADQALYHAKTNGRNQVSMF